MKDLILKHITKFKTYDELLQSCIISIVRKSFIDKKFLEIKKLLLNSVHYLKSNNISKLSDIEFTINGNHNTYNVLKQNNEYICECPMFKKIGKYSNI